MRTTTGHALNSFAFTAANGTGAFNFSISPGESGITINPSTGVVNVDSSTSVRTYFETVTATDSVGATAIKTMVIYVADHVIIGGGSNILTTTGRADSSTAFTVQNGTSTFTYSISPNNNLGITINATSGVIYVAANALPGTYLETVTVTDSVTDQSSTQITIKVNDAVSVGAGSDINTTFGTARSSAAFVAVNGTTQATGGSGNFTYSLTPYNSHISIDSANGVVTVDSTLAANNNAYVETVVATDSLNQKGYKTISVKVNFGIVITPGSNIATSYGIGLGSTAFSATNGTASSGSIPSKTATCAGCVFRAAS